MKVVTREPSGPDVLIEYMKLVMVFMADFVVIVITITIMIKNCLLYYCELTKYIHSDHPI